MSATSGSSMKNVTTVKLRFSMFKSNDDRKENFDNRELQSMKHLYRPNHHPSSTVRKPVGAQTVCCYQKSH